MQRAASTSSGAANEAAPTRLNIAALASTTLAAGSIAWYYHLYGPVAFASTPAEEGYVEIVELGCFGAVLIAGIHHCGNKSYFETVGNMSLRC